LSGFFVFVRAADGRGAGFFTGVHTVLFRSRCDICRGQTRGLVPPIHTHHRPQAHPRRPRQPIPQRRHATVLAPHLLERQKLAPTKSKPATTHKCDNQQTNHPTTSQQTSTNRSGYLVSPNGGSSATRTHTPKSSSTQRA